MTTEILIDNDSVILDTETIYNGSSDNIPDNEKLVRKALGLPITKQLVYYPNKRDPASVVDVVNYRIASIVNGNFNDWYVIEITTKDSERTLIHNSYLVEMQKPSFVSDMNAQSKKYASKD